MAIVVDVVNTIIDLSVVRSIKDHTVAKLDLIRKEEEIPLIDLGTHLCVVTVGALCQTENLMNKIQFNKNMKNAPTTI